MTILRETSPAESAPSEIKTINLVDATQAVMRRWKFVVAATILGGICGLIGAWLVPPVWESEASVQIGSVYGRALEDPRTLASLVASDAFRRSLPTQYRATRYDVLRVQSVDGGSGSVAYVVVTARGRTAHDAQALASYIVEFVTRRHENLFKEATRDYSEYQDLVARNLKQVETGITQLETELPRVSAGRDGAVMVLLIQSQLESKRIQQIELAKQLRDSRYDEAVNTRPTAALGPVSTPTAPVWPRREFFAVAAAALFFIASITVILIARSLATPAR